MIKTNKEWKRAFKGAGIFVGSIIVLFCILFTFYTLSEDSEPESKPTSQVKNEKKEPVYSSKEEYADFMSYYMIPILDKESSIVNAYNDAFNAGNDVDIADPMLNLAVTISIFEEHSNTEYLNLSIESSDSTDELITPLEKIPTPKSFNEYEANEFESMLSSYKDYLVIRKSLYEDRMTFIQTYQNSGLRFVDFVLQSGGPTPVFNEFLKNKTDSNNELIEAQNEYLESIYSISAKYDYNLTNVFGASEFSTNPM